jgi:hypothetical protein
VAELNPVQLNLVVPPVAPEQPAWGELLRALERRFAGCELAWQAERVQAPGGGEGARRVRLGDRDLWVRSQLAQGTHAHLFSGPEQVAVNVLIDPRITAAQDGSQSCRIGVWLRGDVIPTAQLPELLASVAEAANALHASYLPLAAATLLLQLLYGAQPRPGSPAATALARQPAFAGLPALSPRADHLATAAAPAQLGWINHWSAATARYLDLGPSAAQAFWRCESRPTGAWLATLTAEPLDLERPDHAAALVDAYRRLPKLGWRRT